MVIDSSALIAILLAEPGADTMQAAIHAAPVRLIGTPSYLETAMVLIGRLGPTGPEILDNFVEAIAADIVPFTADHAQRAIAAFLRFGKAARIRLG